MRKLIFIPLLLTACPDEIETGRNLCEDAQDCEDLAIAAMGGCGSAEGPCTDPVAGACEQGQCLASCRLTMAYEGIGCQEEAAPAACASGKLECLADCYAAADECYAEQSDCGNYAECTGAKGDCVAKCNEW